jgi:hypothetical protein
MLKECQKNDKTLQALLLELYEVYIIVFPFLNTSV